MEKNIKELIKKVRGIQVAKSLLEDFHEIHLRNESRLIELEELSQNQLSRIRRLTRKSFYSVFKKLTGELDQNLEIAKDQYLNLMLEFNDLVKSNEKIEKELLLLDTKILKEKEFKSELRIFLNKNKNLARSIDFAEYLSLIELIGYKTGLIKEIEEAIEEGVILNKKFNNAIRFIRKKAEEVYSIKKNLQLMNSYEVYKLDTYQKYMVDIQHGMIKFEIEINDVYEKILEGKEKVNISKEIFFSDYRENLIADLRSKSNLDNSYTFLKNHKSLIMGFTKTLRKDLRKLRKEVSKLETQEEKILNSI